MAPEFNISAQDFREDSLSRKSDVPDITHASLEEMRQAYLNDHPEFIQTAGMPAAEPSIG